MERKRERYNIKTLLRTKYIFIKCEYYIKLNLILSLLKQFLLNKLRAYTH